MNPPILKLEIVQNAFFQSSIGLLTVFSAEIREYRLYQLWINDELKVYRWHLHCCIVDTCIAEKKSCVQIFENRALRG